MLRSLDIKGLFNCYDYFLSVPREGETMIITGPNGYGKTTIFTIIEALSNNDLLYFHEIPFSEIIADFEEFKVHILSINEDNKKNSGNQDEVTVPQKQVEFIFIGADNNRLGSFKIDQDRINTSNKRHFWFRYNNQDEENETPSELEKRINIVTEIIKSQKALGLFTLLQSGKTDTKFIKSQRLFNISEEEHTEAVKDISESLKGKLSEAYFNYLVKSQDIDSNFIEVLMKSDECISEQDYSAAVMTLKEKIEHLKRYDLNSSYKIPEYRKDKSHILNCFVTETIKKLSSYDGILNELDIFTSMIQNKCFSNKSITISYKDGIRFSSGSSIATIPLDKLSSGEKNEIIMLYNFIFDLKEGDILLIDEPEISLHVAWQNEFMKDITNIARQRKIRVMIATHSPQIIGGMWNLCYDLYEQSEKI